MVPVIRERVKALETERKEIGDRIARADHALGELEASRAPGNEDRIENGRRELAALERMAHACDRALLELGKVLAWRPPVQQRTIPLLGGPTASNNRPRGGRSW